MIWHDGKIRRARIAPRGAAFDVDLGVNRQGREVAVYSRCRRTDPQRPRDWLPVHAFDDGCDLYEYDIAARRERRLRGPNRRATSEFLPAIERGRLVFARSKPARKRGAPRFPALISARLKPYRERTLRQPGKRYSQLVTGENQGPVAVDAAGGQAVVGYEYVVRTPECFGADDPVVRTWTARQILLYDLRDGALRTLENDCGPRERGYWFSSPALDGGAPYCCRATRSATRSAGWTSRAPPTWTARRPAPTPS